MDMAQMRRMVALEAEAKAAAETLASVSRELRSLGCDIKLSAWNWDRPGYTASISPQGSLHVAIGDLSERG